MLMENCFTGMWLGIHIFAEVSWDKIFKNTLFKHECPRSLFRKKVCFSTVEQPSAYKILWKSVWPHKIHFYKLYDTQGNFTVGLSCSKIVVLYPPPLSLDEHLKEPKPQPATQALPWPQGGVCAQEVDRRRGFPCGASTKLHNTEHSLHVPPIGNRKVAVIWVLSQWLLYKWHEQGC